MSMTIRWKWILECSMMRMHMWRTYRRCFRFLPSFRSSQSTKIMFSRKWTNIWDNNNNCNNNNNYDLTSHSNRSISNSSSSGNINNNQIIIFKNELYIYSEWLQISFYFSLACLHSSGAVIHIHTLFARHRIWFNKTEWFQRNQCGVHFHKIHTTDRIEICGENVYT